MAEVNEIMNTLKKNWEDAVVPPSKPTKKKWSLPDLFIRQYLNNMTDGFNMKNVKKMYIYLLSKKDILIKHGMISKEGYNNSGYELWKDYHFEWHYGIDNDPPHDSVDEDTIIFNVVCNVCKNTLPPHSIKRHLNKDDKIHKCPHTHNF